LLPGVESIRGFAHAAGFAAARRCLRFLAGKVVTFSAFYSINNFSFQISITVHDACNMQLRCLCLSVCLSVYPSVCPSVTRAYSAEPMIKQQRLNVSPANLIIMIEIRPNNSAQNRCSR